MKRAPKSSKILAAIVTAFAMLFSTLILTSCGNHSESVPKDKPAPTVQHTTNSASVTSSKDKAEDAASAADKHFDELNSKMNAIESQS